MSVPADSHLTGVAETLFIPLCMRYFETERADAIIVDQEAGRILHELGYDCRKFAGMPMTQLGTAIRTEIFDREAAHLLVQHPQTVVVNLGAGLCTRFGRLDNGQVMWIELDLAEVSQVWHRVLQETERHRFLAFSVMDFTWIDQVKAVAGSRPVLLIAEGLLMYFRASEVRRLLLALRDAFPGGDMLVEAIGRLMACSSRYHPALAKTRAVFQWGLGTWREVEQWGSGIRCQDEWYYLGQHRGRWGWLRLLKAIPPLHKQMKIGHLRFL